MGTRNFALVTVPLGRIRTHNFSVFTRAPPRSSATVSATFLTRGHRPIGKWESGQLILARFNRQDPPSFNPIRATGEDLPLFKRWEDGEWKSRWDVSPIG